MKLQVSRQLLNYKKKRYGFNQVAVILSSTDLEERIRGGMSMSLMAFVTDSRPNLQSSGSILRIRL